MCSARAVQSAAVVAAQCVWVNVRSAAGSSVGLARSRARASIYSTVTPRSGGTGAVTGKQESLSGLPGLTVTHTTISEQLLT